MVLVTHVKIDQIVLTSIRIISIRNMVSLANQGYLTVSNYGLKYTTEEGQQFSYLHILDDKIPIDLKAGYNKGGAYCLMRLSILPDKETGNLRCYSVEEYYNHLALIQEYLLNRYGLEVYLEESRLKEIEINRTFYIDKPFTDYHRVFEMISSNIPNRFRRGNDHYILKDNKKIYKEYSFTTRKKNNSDHYITLKIYDKSQKIDDCLVNICRIELNPNYS